MTITKYASILGRDTYNIQQISSDNKRFSFNAHDLGLRADTVYKFRAAIKCKAGFLTIVDREGTPRFVANNWKRNCLQALQVNLKGAPGYEDCTEDCWISCLNIKGNKFASISKTILECLTVGDIHCCYPKMADFKHWNSIGSKTHADSAFGDIDAMSIPSSLVNA